MELIKTAKEVLGINNSLFQEIKRNLDRMHAKPAIIKTNSGKLSIPKILEIYVFVMIAQIFSEEGWEARIAPNNEANSITFRGAPGGRGNNNFNYILLTKGNPAKEIELHVGLEVRGDSFVLHEIDVLLCEVFPNTTDIEMNQLLLASEIKRYNKTKLDKSIARKFVGVLADGMLPLDNNNHGNDKVAFMLSNVQDRDKDIGRYLKFFNVNFFTNIEKGDSVKTRCFKNSVRKLARSI